MAAELELSKVDNKTKVETTLQEQAAIQQENKEREQEREREAELARANQAAAASSSFDAETLRDTAPLVEGHKVRRVFLLPPPKGCHLSTFSLSVDGWRWWNVSPTFDYSSSSVAMVLVLVLDLL